MLLIVCGILFIAVLVVGVLAASFIAMGIGTWRFFRFTRDQNTQRRWRRRNYAIMVLVAGIVFCMVAYPTARFLSSVPGMNRTTMDDPRIEPMLAAMEQVDRESLGFTPIPPDARVSIETSVSQWQKQRYDIMLHIYADTSRTVSFRKDGDSYKWIGEQETHYGPGQYDLADGGSIDEHITITYETAHVSGVPLRRIDIRYMGNDPRLKMKSNLTLQDVEPILEEWKRR